MIKKRVIFFSSDSEKEQCSEVKKDEELHLLKRRV